MMEKEEFTFLELLYILSVVVLCVLILAIELVEIDFDGFVGVPFVLGGAKGADEGVLVALGIETDEVDLLIIVAFLWAMDVLDNVGGNFCFHNKRFI